MPDNIKRYKTIHHTSHKGLDEEVTKALASGWQLFGNPYTINDSQGPVLCQAMVSTSEAAGVTSANEPVARLGATQVI